MKQIALFLAVVSLALFASACGSKSAKKATSSSPAPSHTNLVSIADDSVDVILRSSGDTLMLSSQKLTCYDNLLEVFDNHKDQDYLHESTPATSAFFFREPDIRDTETARALQVRYNYAAAINRVLHGYEWFERVSSDVDEDVVYTMKDTLAWIRESQPKLSKSFIAKAIPNKAAADEICRMLDAYRRFNGVDDEQSDFAKEFQAINKVFDGLPNLAPSETFLAFKDGFWDWYDKEKIVPGIDKIIRMHLQDFKGERLTEDQIRQLELTVKREKDIDRRTVLALELVKFAPHSGIMLLGDILESGLYTKYLLEAWISWRANLQMDYSPSSFSVIPNNFYDQIRVKCLNTFLRHYQANKDGNTLCLMENMLLCEVLHRMASIAGNESLATCAQLSYDYFIHPRLLDKE